MLPVKRQLLKGGCLKVDKTTTKRKHISYAPNLLRDNKNLMTSEETRSIQI